MDGGCVASRSGAPVARSQAHGSRRGLVTAETAPPGLVTRRDVDRREEGETSIGDTREDPRLNRRHPHLPAEKGPDPALCCHRHPDASCSLPNAPRPAIPGAAHRGEEPFMARRRAFHGAARRRACVYACWCSIWSHTRGLLMQQPCGASRAYADAHGAAPVGICAK